MAVSIATHKVKRIFQWVQFYGLGLVLHDFCVLLELQEALSAVVVEFGVVGVGHDCRGVSFSRFLVVFTPAKLISFILKGLAATMDDLVTGLPVAKDRHVNVVNQDPHPLIVELDLSKHIPTRRTPFPQEPTDPIPCHPFQLPLLQPNKRTAHVLLRFEFAEEAQHLALVLGEDVG